MKVMPIFSIIAALIFCSGCEVVRLNNGKYETSIQGRGDFAAVYGDLIILRLRNAVNESGTENGYWDWGGTYSIREDNVIELNMDRETARHWGFYYQLRKYDNGIRVIDHRAENYYQLNYIPAVPVRRQNTPAAPAVYPAYQ